MKFKLDENVGSRTKELFVAARHDVETVHEEQLSGIPDTALYEACILEARCLVTLDVDFADVLRFPPDRSAGIAVLRHAGTATVSLLRKMVSDPLRAVEQESISGRLWIVEPGRIRVHEPDESNL